MVCWKCGVQLIDQPLPLSRTAQCRACAADLHVCRQCRQYDGRALEWCREDRAEPPRERDRANFCDWFDPAEQAFVAAQADRQTDRQAAAEAALAALFGESPPPASRAQDDPQDPSRDPLAAAEALFRKD